MSVLLISLVWWMEIPQFLSPLYEFLNIAGDLPDIQDPKAPFRPLAPPSVREGASILRGYDAGLKNNQRRRFPAAIPFPSRTTERDASPLKTYERAN